MSINDLNLIFMASPQIESSVSIQQACSDWLCW